MATTRKILSYEEMLEKFPDWRIFDTDTYYRESTPEATEAARLRVLRYTGIAIKFMQDHGLTRRVLCETAPDIPEDFRVYLRDITPEGLEFDRTGFMKWLDRLDRTMHADPSDVSVMEKALAEMRAKVAPAADPQQCADSKPNIKSRQSSKKPGLIKKYDDMSWHSEGDFPSDLSEDAGCTHIGMFWAWALLHELYSKDHAEDFEGAIEQLQKRQTTPGKCLLQYCDGKFTSDELNATGNRFTRAYYDVAKGEYIHDYEFCLAKGLPSTYHVPDTWETYDKLEPIINARFGAWKRRGK